MPETRVCIFVSLSVSNTVLANQLIGSSISYIYAAVLLTDFG